MKVIVIEGNTERPIEVDICGELENLTGTPREYWIMLLNPLAFEDKIESIKVKVK